MKGNANKSKKICIPIICVLAILTIGFIALSVLIKINGSHKSSKNTQEDTSIVEAMKNGTEVEFLAEYSLDDYTSSVGSQNTADAQNTASTSAKMADPNGYIIPNSSSVLLTEADLAGLTAEELSYARNEIYARYGYVFESSKLNEYFATKSWYTANATVTESVLNETEKKNAEFIKAYQETNNLKYDVK